MIEIRRFFLYSVGICMVINSTKSPTNCWNCGASWSMCGTVKEQLQFLQYDKSVLFWNLCLAAQYALLKQSTLLGCRSWWFVVFCGGLQDDLHASTAERGMSSCTNFQGAYIKSHRKANPTSITTPPFNFDTVRNIRRPIRRVDRHSWEMPKRSVWDGTFIVEMNRRLGWAHE
jgi:hypothetical protein